MYTWYRKKYHFYEQEICKHICAQHFPRENGVLQERQIWLGCLSIPLWRLFKRWFIMLCLVNFFCIYKASSEKITGPNQF